MSENQNNESTVVFYYIPVLGEDGCIYQKRVVLKEFDNWQDASELVDKMMIASISCCYGFTDKDSFEKNYKDQLF